MFKLCAYRWGCDHEQKAIDCYTCEAAKSHSNLEVSEVGFFIDVNRPYIGAPPDGFVKCDCCGHGLIEVKCPHCIKDELPEEEYSGFCMEKHNNEWTLKRNHRYYYQVQVQLHVTGHKHCGFVVWAANGGILKERILIDHNFFNSFVDDAEYFFKYGLLPELVGKWYTRKPVEELSLCHKRQRKMMQTQRIMTNPGVTAINQVMD